MHRHTRPHRTVAVLTVATFALAACGGDDDAPEATPTTTDADTEDAAPSTTATGAEGITIADFAFSGVSEVPVGTTVVVTNDDAVTHTWTASDGSFDSGPISPGDSFEFTFTEAGDFAYFCSIHPSMTGTITVTG